MANERHTDVRGWEIDASTRQAVHPYTKYKPFRTATSTTAANLTSISRGEVATNWVTNPRIENADVTMYVAAGSAISRDTGQQASGAASLLVNPANSAAGEGFYWVSPKLPFSTSPQYLSVQLEHRGASASGAVTLEIRADDGTTVLATSGSDDLATSWRRLTAQYTVVPSTATASYRLYLTTTAQHNINFYADKIMFEVREDTTSVSTYLDGSISNLYDWTGTAELSTSVKKPDADVIRGIKITNESSTAAEVIYVAFDTTATATTGIPVLAGASLDTNFPIDFRKNVSVIAAQGTPTVSGVIWGIAGS